MSEKDTMFNERDRRCAAVQPCSLPIQVMTIGPLPAPSKCKSGRFNAWWHSPTHRTNLWRWWSGRTPTGRPGPRSSSKRSRQSLMKLPSGLFARNLGVSHTTVNACVKEDLKCRSYRRQTRQILTEKIKNPRQIKSVRPPSPTTWTRWTTSFGHTSRTPPTWPPKVSLIAAIHRVFAELSLALVEKACSQFRIRIEAVIESEGGYFE